mmetsp:Transcript_4281/g.6297  ORF Transcript_4281/g.6297 Transcript_4281/m.6297 type:complete len:293 (+) Transcript_4281:29-907(+)
MNLPSWTQILAGLGTLSVLYILYKLYNHVFPKNPCVFTREKAKTAYKQEVPVLCGVVFMSPFVIKVQTYLRMAGIEYKEHKTADMMSSPTGKVPFLLHRGQLICDSSEIIEYLKIEYPSKTLEGDKELEGKKHMVTMIQRLLEDHFYWLLVFLLWATKEGANWVTKKYFSEVPALIRPFLVPYIINDLRNTCVAVGVGRYTDEVREKKWREDCIALNEVLGDKPFMLTHQNPSSADVLAYSFLSSLLSNQEVKTFDKLINFLKKSTPQLVAYHDRIHATYFDKKVERVIVPI